MVFHENYSTWWYSFLESEKLSKLSNHPVHLIDENGDLSPTALIPFCDLGGDMSAMGVKALAHDLKGYGPTMYV